MSQIPIAFDIARARAARWDADGSRRWPTSLVLAIVMGACGSLACRNERQVIEEQRQAIASLRATAAAIGNAWLGGTVSSTYARTALEATQQLVEKQRTALTASPRQLAHPDAIALTEAGNRLTQDVALLWKAVDEADADAVRRYLSAVAGARADSP